MGYAASNTIKILIHNNVLKCIKILPSFNIISDVLHYFPRTYESSCLLSLLFINANSFNTESKSNHQLILKIHFRLMINIVTIFEFNIFVTV